MASSRSAIFAYRIVKSVYATSAFSGEGTRINGGRWTSPGNAVVYTADSIALAALELIVHLQSGTALEDYVVIPCRFNERLLTSFDPKRLPENWRQSPAPAALREIGDEWFASRASVALEVPSVVVIEQRNYVLNPLHEDFRLVAFRPPKRFAFDERLTPK